MQYNCSLSSQRYWISFESHLKVETVQKYEYQRVYTDLLALEITISAEKAIKHALDFENN